LFTARLENAVKCTVIEVYRKYRAAKGRHKKATLDGYCKVLMLDEVSDTKEMHEKLKEALADAEEWKGMKILKRRRMSCMSAWHNKINTHETEKEN